VGRPRGAAGCPGADVGLARRCADTSRRRARAHLGISAAPFRSPSAASGRAELGRTAAHSRAAGARSAGGGAGMGRSRARAVVGRAGTGPASATGTGACTGAYGTASASASAPASRSAGRGAFVERAICAACADLGCAPRLAELTDSNGAVVEPTGSSLERACAGRLNPASTLFPRLGCAAGVRGATHSCSVVERARTGGLGRPQNRRARRSRRALVVGPIGRAQWLSSLELARRRRSPRTCSVVTSGAGRARAQPDGRGPRRRGRVPR